ncbi:MAG TPA: hypothetical protein VMU19_09540 [Bryobacteraceae bacterium]|nr:hypothetical protein [Bryobacteraceae bacterium]
MEWVGPAGAMGSDDLLAQRLRARGAKVWWIAESLVEHKIRPEQLTRAWMLRRATSFGRGRYWLDEDFRRPAPELMGAPRWLARHIMEQSGRVASAWLRGDAAGLFRERWNLNVLWGAMAECRRMRGAARRNP